MGTLGVESGIGLLRAILVEMGPTTEHEHAKRSKETRVTPPVAVGARVTPKVRPPWHRLQMVIAPERDVDSGGTAWIDPTTNLEGLSR